MRIDAHQHFWKYSPDRHVWMTDEMQSLKTDFLPDSLQPNLQAVGIDGCVSVQADQSEDENKFLMDLAYESGFIKGIVGWVDLRDENIDERLTYYKQFPVIKGFRHVLHDEPQRDYMLRSDFMRGISYLRDFDFTYDILVFTDQLKFTNTFIKKFPEQPFVIDHIAKPLIKEQLVDGWKREMENIASHQNTYCKISGLVTEADWNGWKKDDFKRYIDIVLDLFGIDRLMYGSDWPVCQLAASYKEQFDIVDDYFRNFSKEEQACIFGKNATTFYRL